MLARANKWLLNLLRCGADPGSCSGPQRAVQNVLEPPIKLFCCWLFITCLPFLWHFNNYGDLFICITTFHALKNP